ncbi:hypothetical protein MBEHAL_1083 [Halarchaeum acidiphilum MH1-52-1]|uniref:ABC-2 type transport system permease protein n=1 Tax=Halarchaeum acidiphilum MH1-52-1 TaxID=1261545 RepID=U3AC39_9EURY|nr:hypothetical protein [Halarchaeum acidiphilum]GAD52323.1 hypothetical protein MBEHAL_1083 [Halarchaeum acidiphilum MH1-52-1]
MSHDRAVLAAMFREEWRLHSRLFGGRRFAAFPVFVALVGGVTAWALASTGAGTGTVVAGVHVLVLLFGLQTGSVGLVGRDAMRGLLDDTTLVVFSAHTLPLRQRRLLGLFLLKDVVYYAVLLLLPLAVAFAPLLALAALPLLWVTLLWTFGLGLCATVAVVALATRGRPGKLLAALGVCAVVAGWLLGLPVVAATPYAVFLAPGLDTAVAAAVPPLALLALAAVTYDPEHEPPARTAANAYRAWRRRVPAWDDPVFVKTMLDVSRSAGGYWKVLLSAGVLFVVSAFLVSLAESLVGLRVLPGVAFGSILGLTAFTTYNWLTQFEDATTYATLPVDTAAVFDAKRRAFAVLGLPTGIACYAVAVLWQGASPLDALAGLALCVGLQAYLFGLTVALAGFQPNEFLFDTVLFALFTLAVAVPLVPVLVVGFVAAPLTAPWALGLVAVGLALAGIGHVLYGRAVPRWRERYRA